MKHFLTSGVSAVFLLLTLSLVSCDKDYTELDSGLNIDDDDLNIEKIDFATVRAFNQPVREVQTNNLAINPLGILRNGSTFGTTHADFVTQVELSTTALVTEFGTNASVDSVDLYIPYFSTKLLTDTDGNSEYELDSIYGSQKMRLEVFESNYFINALAPPDFSQPQVYYTSSSNVFQPLLKGAFDDGTTAQGAPALNNSTNTQENENFKFSDREIYLTAPNEDDPTKTDTTRLAPGMRLRLNKNYFQKKIIQAPDGKMTNNTTFRDYMRGLYFKTTATSPTGSSYGMLNFKGGTITMYYSEDKSATDPTRVHKTFIINLTGNTVSLQDNTFGTSYETALNNVNQTQGDEVLYLKGGNGSVVYIDLFGERPTTGDPAQLETMREQGWLINEANLTFTVDQRRVGTLLQPMRVYLYNADTNVPIADYTLDVTTSSNRKYDKYIFGGFLSTDDTTGEQTYTIRLTNHLRALVKGTLDDVRLGLAVTESIGAADNLKANSVQGSGTSIEIPRGSVLHPFGTVLKGNTAEAKNIKFEVRYTRTKFN